MERLSELLDDAAVKLQKRCQPEEFQVLCQLAEQSIAMGIDYRSIGVGWNHPSTRMAYRKASHRSTRCEQSRKRQERSKERFIELAEAKDPNLKEAIVQLFLTEIGADHDLGASFGGVAAALKAELLLPLRALNECGPLSRTMTGAPLPAEELRKVILELTKAVVSKEGGFSEWRYSTPAGQEQLRGLSPEQIDLWRQSTSMDHAGGLVTHEDAQGELGFFWATKIGGPSHGFDYETQCILPLLCNARHKVILVSDPRWTCHPVGRAHWRLLWSVGNGKKKPEPRLWLETVNADFEAPVSNDGWELAVLSHAMRKAEDMNVTLSVDTYMGDLLQRLIDRHACSHDAVEIRERILLRPSKAVLEASDYLSHKHDWVQDEDEITAPIGRSLYTPGRKRSHSEHST